MKQHSKDRLTNELDTAIDYGLMGLIAEDILARQDSKRTSLFSREQVKDLIKSHGYIDDSVAEFAATSICYSKMMCLEGELEEVLSGCQELYSICYPAIVNCKPWLLNKENWSVPAL